MSNRSSRLVEEQMLGCQLLIQQLMNSKPALWSVRRRSKSGESHHKYWLFKPSKVSKYGFWIVTTFQIFVVQKKRKQGSYGTNPQRINGTFFSEYVQYGICARSVEAARLLGVSASLVRWLSLFEFASLFECNKYVNFSTTKLLSTMMCDVKEFPGNLLLSPFEL